MADTVVTVIVRAQDEASAALKKTAVEIAALARSGDLMSNSTVKVVRELSQLSPALSRVVEPAARLGSAFDSVVTEAAKTAGGLGRLLAVAVPVIGAVAALATAAAALNAAFAAAKEGGAFADNLGDIAARTGLTVAEVSRLNFVATQTDTSLSALTGSFRFLSRSLIEARDTTSETRDLFLALGFTAAELDGGLVDARQAMLRLADAFKTTNSPITQSAIATKLLGRSAQELIPFLQGGSAGILALEGSADQLNTTVTEAAAVAGDQYTKALARAQLSTLALKSDIGAGLLPAITRLIDALTAATGAARQFGEGADQLGRVALILSGIDPSRVEEFFTRLPGLIRASIPLLNDVLRIVELISSFAPPKLFTDVKAGGSNTAEEDVLKVAAALKAKREADEKAREAAARHGEQLAELSAAFERAAASAFLVSRATAGILFDVDPGKAAGAVAALQKALQAISATPLGVTVDGEKLLASVEQAAAGLRVQISIEIDPAKRDALERELADIEARARRLGSGVRQPTGQPVPAPLKIEGAAIEEIFDSDLDKRLAAARDEASALHDALEQLGIDTKNIVAPLESLPGTLQAIGEALETGFKFDPILRGAEDAVAAMVQFRETTIGVVDDALRGLFTAGAQGFKSFADGARAAGEAVKKLVLDVIVLTIRTLIFKVISAGLFASGGVTSGVQTIASAATGGYLRAFAGGGQVAREDDPPRAGATVRAAIGGFIQQFASGDSVTDGAPGGRFRGPGTGTSDSILARVSDGEFIVRSTVVERPGVLSFLRVLNAEGGLAAPFASGGWAKAGALATTGLAVMLAGGGPPRVDARPGGQLRGPGTATSDDIPAWLSDREFVVRTAIVERPGTLPFLRALNAGKVPPSFLEAFAAGPARAFAAGGLAAAFADGGSVGTSPGNVESTTRETFRESIREWVREVAPAASATPARPPIHITINARDADSVRRDLSQGGRSYRAIQRLQDEGRL